MIKGVTSTGFKYTVDPLNLEDFYLLECFGQAQSGDIPAMGKLLELMLGKEQKAALLKHCEDEKGRAAISKVGDEIADIYKGATADKKAKNS
jgi:hypothetical protein